MYGIEARNAKEKPSLGLLIVRQRAFTRSKWARERKMDKHGRNVKARKGKDILKAAGTTAIEAQIRFMLFVGSGFRSTSQQKEGVRACALCYR
jgi:hypothetical protein